MDCKTCNELRAVCKDSEKSASISVHLHEAQMARMERTITSLCIGLYLSVIANLIIIAVSFFG
jgi:hypothetical protein